MLVLSQLVYAIVARSEWITVGRLGLFTNPYVLGAIGLSGALQIAVMTVPPLRAFFETVVHGPGEWLRMAALTVAPAAAIEAFKAWAGRRSRRA